jgi:malate/lactate dehydrogenase
MNPKPGTSREGPAHPTHIAVVGAGAVGSSFAFALLLPGLTSEIVLIDANERKADRIVREFSVERSARTTAERFDDLLAGSQ